MHCKYQKVYENLQMPKPTALLAVASGSSDIDVIVTSSQLTRLGVDVIIASADGWSPVTLQNGLVIRPTCSLDRFFYSKTYRSFDLLLLPDGDDVSYGRLWRHPQLSNAVKSLIGEPCTFDKKLEDDKAETGGFCRPYIIFAGVCAKLRQAWGLRRKKESGRLKSWFGRSMSCFLSGAKGSEIVIWEDSNVANVILCCPSSPDDPLKTVSLCVLAAEASLVARAKEEELVKYGNLVFSALEARRNLEKQNGVPVIIRRAIANLRDSAWVPNGIRRFILSPLCASISHRDRPFYYPARLLPGLNERANEETEEISGDGALQIATKSAVHVMRKMGKFVVESLELVRRPLPMCKAAILVCNRVNEEILAVLVHSMRSKFKMMTQVIACDRAVLQTRDPFIITRGMLQIRADKFIETTRPCYDVVVAVDSEVESRGPGMWYRRGAFHWDEFEMVLKNIPRPNVSCVTATFDTKGDNGTQTLESVSRKRFNPLTNKWILLDKGVEKSKEMSSPENVPEAEFFKVCNKVVDKVDGLFRIEDDHDLVFHTFRPLHDHAAMHTSISSQSSTEDALDFSRAVTDCLRRLAIKNGHCVKTLSERSSCSIL